MSETSTLIGYQGRTIGRADLALVPTPPATDTHRPVGHGEIVQALVETLGFRHIGVVHDEYAVSADGMKMFGILELEAGMTGIRFSIGLRNANDKSMRLALTVGYRVMVCSNMAFHGDFTPVLAKHSKSFSLIDCISVGIDRMQRNIWAMRWCTSAASFRSQSEDRPFGHACPSGQLDAGTVWAQHIADLKPSPVRVFLADPPALIVWRGPARSTATPTWSK